MIPEGFEKVDRCVCLLHLASKKCWQSDRPFLLFLCITLAKLGSPKRVPGHPIPALGIGGNSSSYPLTDTPRFLRRKSDIALALRSTLGERYSSRRRPGISPNSETGGPAPRATTLTLMNGFFQHRTLPTCGGFPIHVMIAVS